MANQKNAIKFILERIEITDINNRAKIAPDNIDETMDELNKKYPSAMNDNRIAIIIEMITRFYKFNFCKDIEMKTIDRGNLQKLKAN